MNRREFLKACGVALPGIMVSSLPLVAGEEEVSGVMTAESDELHQLQKVGDVIKPMEFIKVNILGVGDYYVPVEQAHPALLQGRREHGTVRE